LRRSFLASFYSYDSGFRLKILETPLFVSKGLDDLRFLFGTRFDIGALFGRLKFLQTIKK